MIKWLLRAQKQTQQFFLVSWQSFFIHTCNTPCTRHLLPEWMQYIPMENLQNRIWLVMVIKTLSSFSSVQDEKFAETSTNIDTTARPPSTSQPFLVLAQNILQYTNSSDGRKPELLFPPGGFWAAIRNLFTRPYNFQSLHTSVLVIGLIKHFSQGKCRPRCVATTHMVECSQKTQSSYCLSHRISKHILAGCKTICEWSARVNVFLSSPIKPAKRVELFWGEAVAQR